MQVANAWRERCLGSLLRQTAAADAKLLAALRFAAYLAPSLLNMGGWGCWPCWPRQPHSAAAPAALGLLPMGRVRAAAAADVASERMGLLKPLAGLAYDCGPRNEVYVSALLQQQPAVGVRLLSLAVGGMAKAAAECAETAAREGRPVHFGDWLFMARTAFASDAIGWGSASRLAFAPGLMRSWQVAAGGDAAAHGDAALAAETQQLQQACQAAIHALQRLLQPCAAGAAGAAAPCQPSLPSFAGSLAALLQQHQPARGDALPELWAWQLAGTMCSAAGNYASACSTIDGTAASQGSQPAAADELFPGAVSWAQEQLVVAAGMISACLPALVEQQGRPGDSDATAEHFGAAAAGRALGSFCSAVTAVGGLLEDRPAAAADGTAAAGLLAAVCAVVEAVARSLAACWQRPAPAGWPGRQLKVEQRVSRPPGDELDSHLRALGTAVPLMHTILDRCAAQAGSGSPAAGQQAVQQGQRERLLRGTLLSLRSVCKLAQVTTATAASPQHGCFALAERLACTGECMQQLACAVAECCQRSPEAVGDSLRCVPGRRGCRACRGI